MQLTWRAFAELPTGLFPAQPDLWFSFAFCFTPPNFRVSFVRRSHGTAGTAVRRSLVRAAGSKVGLDRYVVSSRSRSSLAAATPLTGRDSFRSARDSGRLRAIFASTASRNAASSSTSANRAAMLSQPPSSAARTGACRRRRAWCPAAPRWQATRL